MASSYEVVQGYRETDASKYNKLLVLAASLKLIPKKTITSLSNRNRQLEQNFLIKNSDFDKIVFSISWYCFLVNLCCLLERKIFILLNDNPAKKSQKLYEKIKICRQTMKEYLSRIIRRILRANKNKKEIIYILLDYAVRAGDNELFEYILNDSILRFPQEESFWNIALKRKLYLQDYSSALILAKKYYKISNNSKVQILINKLVLTLKLVINANKNVSSAIDITA